MSFWLIYSFFYNLTLNKFFPYQKLTEDLIDSLEIRNGEKILDAGCGPGFLIRKIAEKNEGKNLEILGIDSNQKMINYARKRCADFPEINLKFVDLNKNLGLPENSFDKIVCLNTLYALENPQKVIEQFYRILNSGGYLVISNPKPGAKGGKLFKAQIKALIELKPISKKIYHWLLFFLTMPISIIIGIINKIILERAKKGKYHFLDKEELEKIYQRSGFKNIKITSTYADQNWLVRGEK